MFEIKISVVYMFITKEQDKKEGTIFNSYILTKEIPMTIIASEHSKQFPFSVKEHTLEYLQKNYGEIVEIISKKIDEADSDIEDLFEKYEVILKK